MTELEPGVGPGGPADDSADALPAASEQCDPSAAGDEAQAHPSRRPGFYVTPRQTFAIMAGLLSVLLVGLLLYLYWLSRPADFTSEGGAAQGGLKPLFAIYGPGRRPLPNLDQPMGVAWNRNGTRLYVADTRNNRICVFDDKGQPVTEFGSLGVAKPLAGSQRTWDPGELSYPVDVAVADDGKVYVADFYNDSISVFTESGRFIRRFPDPYAPTGKGSSGNDGGGIAVTAVAVLGDRVYATDAYQVFVFETDGTVVSQFGRPGLAPDGLDRPAGIAVNRDGTVFVSDSNHNRVIAFSPEGKPLWVTGRPVSGTQSQTDNPFVLPRGMTVLRDGSLLVADPLGQQLVKMSADGKVIAHFGVRGASEGQVNFPNDVDVHVERIAVADRQNQRVQVVALSSR